MCGHVVPKCLPAGQLPTRHALNISPFTGYVPGTLEAQTDPWSFPKSVILSHVHINVNDTSMHICPCQQIRASSVAHVTQSLLKPLNPNYKASLATIHPVWHAAFV